MIPKLEQIIADGTPLMIDTQRVVTHAYGWPRRPFATEYAHDREDLLIAASYGVRDGRSLDRQTIEQICSDYETVATALNSSEERALVAERQLAAQQGLSAGLQHRIASDETEINKLRELNIEASERAAWLAQQLLRLSTENLHLRHQIAGTTPASVEIACRDADDTVVMDPTAGAL